MLYNNCIAGDLVGTTHCNIMIDNIREIVMEYIKIENTGTKYKACYVWLQGLKIGTAHSEKGFRIQKHLRYIFDIQFIH